MDLGYASSIQKPPARIKEKMMDQFTKMRTQTEVQEWLVSVIITPSGVRPNGKSSKTEWTPSYVPEEVLDEAIQMKGLPKGQAEALKQGYQQLFNTMGKSL